MFMELLLCKVFSTLPHNILYPEMLFPLHHLKPENFKLIFAMACRKQLVTYYVPCPIILHC